MTKQAMQKKGVLIVAILMMFVLVFAGMFIASMTGSNKSASAADYSYNENDNTATWDDDTGLTVVFTCTYNGLGMYDWALLLFNSEDFENVPYDEYTHKLTNSGSMGQDSASYYFDSDVSTETGTITVTYGKDLVAQNSSKTLAEIWEEDDWRVVIGPHHDYNYGAYNCDYYVGTSAQIISGTLSITFYDYDGTPLQTSNSIVPPENDPTRTGYTFDGWHCDTNKKVYTSEEVSELSALDLAVGGEVNFYATYKKTNATSDYLEFTVSVASEDGDIVTDGNVGRPYASVSDMDYVSVKYEITHNPGIHNLLLVLDYDTNVFSLDYQGEGKITYPNGFTGLGEATPSADVPDGFVWDITGNAYNSTEEVFTVKYAINQAKVKSGTTYYFGVKIYPYGENTSSVSNRIVTVNNQLGEQVDVPITQIVKTFTPVVRQAATITIGGNMYGDPRFYQRPYGLQFTTEKVETLPEFDVEDDYTEEDAYTVHYTYDGDGVVVVTWYQNVNNQYVAMQDAPQMPGSYKVGISAPATLNYNAVDAVYCEVYIYKLNLEIVIGGGSHTYLGEPVTYYSTSGSASATFTTYLKTQGENPATVTLNSNTDVGTYDIYYNLSYNEDICTVTVDGSSTKGNGIKSNRTYTVYPKAVAFTVLAQGHTYGSSPAELTFDGSETGITFTPSVDVTPALSSTTPVDTYDIIYTLSAASNYKLSNYAITVNGSVAGASGDTGVNYTVSPKTIYLKAMDQTHKYTGQAVPINTGLNKFFFYTTSACTSIYSTDNLVNFNVDDVKFKYVDTNGDPASYSARGLYESVILATYEPATADPNHIIETIRGDLRINGTEADYYYQFFEVFNVTYTGQSQTMIRNKTALPEWVTSVAYKANSGSYGDAIATPSNADPAVIATDAKTNAGTYVYTIELTLSDATYYNGETNVVVIAHQDEDGKRLTASIAKAAITLGAVGGSHTYGQNPTMNYAAPTRGTEYTSSVAPFGDLEVATSINTTLSSTTNAGTYTVTVSATSEGDNFTITYADATAPYTVNKATPSINLVANNVYYNRDLDVTATVTPNVGTATLTYYTDSACTIAVDNNTPVNAGTYYVKASVVGNSNYNSYTTPEAVSFDILQVQLKGVVFSYLTPGYATWSAVTSDYGKTVFDSNETGVAAADIKSGTTLEYDVYEGGVKIATISSGELSLQARAAGQAWYYVITRATNNANYLPSPLVQTVNSCSVTYACDHTNAHTSLDNTEHELPAVQYRFGGQSVTLPALDALDAYSFLYWDRNNNHYNAGSSYQVSASVTFYAVWSKNTYKVYLKYFNELTALELNCDADSNVTYSPSALAKLSGVADDDYRVVAWKHNGNVVYTITGKEGDTIDLGMNPTEAGMVFDAVLEFAIDYYMLEGTAAGADAYENVEAVTEFVEYNTPITYQTIDQAYTWFKTDCWYTDANRTLKNLPATMPASRVSVYGAYKFDIGYGDVDGNGLVNADDITLYRKWIVGGYDMTVVEVGDEWATVTDEDFEYVAGAFFLKKVADINADDSKDVRDVTITRMSIVRGYDWDIESGIRVTGASIERTKTSYNIEALQSALSYGRARIYNNINASTVDVSVEATGDIYLDLNGNTLNLKGLTLIANGREATITITNGTIVSGGAITLSAPNGNVVVNNVTAYVNGQPVNLQAASSSLHLVNNVKFFNIYGKENFSVSDQGEVVIAEGTADNNPVATPINVAEGTHVVVEANAVITVAEIKVAVVEIVDNVPTFTPDNTKAITLTNKTEVATEELITVVGDVTEVYEDTGITTFEELAAATGEVVLGADINCSSDIAYTEDVTIDLNGHNITFSGWGFEAREGATLTINGNGNVTAAEAPLYAQYAGKLVINGGTYTSTDNFVIGTHGGANRGGNEITVNGGVFNGSMSADGIAHGYIACGIYVANDDTVAVNGGTFNITNGVGIVARSGSTTVKNGVVFNMLGDNQISGIVGDAKQPAIHSGLVLVKDLVAGYPGGQPTLTNQTAYDVYTVIGTAAQLTAATGNVVLAANINCSSEIAYTEDVTIDLNGHNITFSGWGFEAREGATLTINGNGNVTAAEAALYAQYAGKLVINGGTYTSTDNFVIGTHGGANRGGNEITINDGEFNGSMSADGIAHGYIACGIYVANNDTVVINAGTFNITDGVGIVARSGSTTVKNGVVFNMLGDNQISGIVGDAKQPAIHSGLVLVKDLVAGYPGGQPTVDNQTSYETVVLG